MVKKSLNFNFSIKLSSNFWVYSNFQIDPRSLIGEINFFKNRCEGQPQIWKIENNEIKKEIEDYMFIVLYV